MELGTAGSILSYAIELETQALEFYESSLKQELTANLVSVLKTIQKQHQKSIKTLDRMRKENVTEMILEPVDGFESDDYLLEISGIESQEGILSSAESIEGLLHDYYEVASEKVSFLRDMSLILGDLRKRSRKNITRLKDAI